MGTKTEFDVTELLDSAASAFSDALKAGVRAQEEVVKWWTSSFDGACAGDFQKRGRQLFDEAIPAAQKQAQDWLKIIDANCRRGVDLVRKAMDSEQDSLAAAFTDASRRLWEETVAVVKENLESMTQANIKMLEVWADLLRKSVEQGDAAIKAVVPKAKQPA